MQEKADRLAKPGPGIRATIIILVHNTPDLLLQCLRSFYEPLCGKNWKIVVVDNGSELDVRSLVEQQFCQVDFIRSDNNLGFAAGNNLGLRVAKGEFIVLVNSDVIANGDVFESLARALESAPHVGAMSPGLVTANGDAQAFAFGGKMSPLYLIRRGLRAAFGLSPLHDWSVRKPLEVEWVSAACICVRRKVVEEVGGLDERFSFYFEDVDWCTRMRAAGWKVVYDPRLTVTHLGGTSHPTGLANRQDLYDRSLLYFYEKHYGHGWTMLIRTFLAVYRMMAARRSLNPR